MVVVERKNSVQNKKGTLVKATFEEAIAATDFGKFNIILLCFVIPSSFTQAFEQMSLSYVMPIAECDLEVTLEQKAFLNAVTFAGMISSGVFFGIVCDTFGRKKLIVYGYLINTICQIFAASASNFMTLMIAKFFCGFMFNGPFSATTTYLSEFHASKYRAKVQLVRGVTFTFGFFCLPLLAWVVLPLDIDTTIFGYFKIHSWNIFLLLCSAAPLTAALVFAVMPESPKFLMSTGKNEEALKVFQLVYSLNTGNAKENFPIKELIIENESTANKTKKGLKASFINGWRRIKPILFPPYVYRLALISSIAMAIILSVNVLKMWLPQLLQITNDYKQQHNGTSLQTCEIINILTSKKVESKANCQINNDNSFVYQMSMIMTGFQMILFTLSGFFINWLGKKKIIIILTSIASASAIGIYLAPNAEVFITFFTTYIPTLELSGVVAITINLEMFPTVFRTIAVAFHLMMARTGIILGNMFFPLLANAGCLPLFTYCVLMTAAIPLLVIMLPNTENKALQ